MIRARSSPMGAAALSILGFFALATAGSEVMRGKAAARFEGATLAGLGIGFIVAPKLFDAIHEQAFYLNAAVYAVALLIFWFGVSDPAGEQDAVASPHVGLNRYVRLVRSAHVLLLAPTWIAVNASIGLWFSQSLYQFSRADDRFPDQVLMAGYDANQITVAAIVIAIVFGIGLLYWGNRFKNMRRTTIILYGILGGGVLVAGGLALNHSSDVIAIVPIAAAGLAGRRLFMLRRATPAAPRLSVCSAAIRRAGALAVIRPSGVGIGGDAFWLIGDAASRQQLALNGSGRAPASANPETLRASGLRTMPLRGPQSITVPGAIRSWDEAHRRFGRLTRDAILAPAIELAQSGFP